MRYKVNPLQPYSQASATKLRNMYGRIKIKQRRNGAWKIKGKNQHGRFKLKGFGPMPTPAVPEGFNLLSEENQKSLMDVKNPYRYMQKGGKTEEMKSLPEEVLNRKYIGGIGPLGLIGPGGIAKVTGFISNLFRGKKLATAASKAGKAIDAIPESYLKYAAAGTVGASAVGFAGKAYTDHKNNRPAPSRPTAVPLAVTSTTVDTTGTGPKYTKSVGTPKAKAKVEVKEAPAAPQMSDKEKRIRAWQQRLGVKVDGIWGKNTEAAYQNVIAAQRRLKNKGLYTGRIDGIVGDKTRAAMAEELKKGPIEGKTVNAEAPGVKLFEPVFKK